MDIRLLFKVVTYAEPLLYIAVLAVMARRKQVRAFGLLSAFMAIEVAISAIFIGSVWSGKLHLISEVLVYKIYFYSYIPGVILRAGFGIGLICLLFQNAMAPLPAMKKLGNIVFYWAAGFSGLVTLCLAVGPRLTGLNFILRFVAELEQTQSVMALALMLFVFLAAKPLGLALRSKLVGISTGFGVLAVADLISSAWIGQTHTLVSVASVVSGSAACVAASVWGAYFWLPEPKAKLILLPTNSNYHHWNSISDVLNDPAGYVAVGEVTTAVFAPAELEVMRRASLRMSEITVEKKLASSVQPYAAQMNPVQHTRMQPYQRYRELTDDEWELVTR